MNEFLVFVLGFVLGARIASGRVQSGGPGGGIPYDRPLPRDWSPEPPQGPPPSSPPPPPPRDERKCQFRAERRVRVNQIIAAARRSAS